jgi:hypothetical protein
VITKKIKVVGVSHDAGGAEILSNFIRRDFNNYFF